MEEKFNLQFRNLNEQLRVWNSSIVRMNQNIETTGDFIRALPTLNPIQTNHTDSSVDDVLRSLDRLPYLDFKPIPKKPLIIRFYTEKPEKTLFFNKYTITLLANGLIPSAVTCMKFDEASKTIGFGGSSCFFQLGIESRATLCSWYCTSASAPNFLRDFEWKSNKGVTIFEDNFIRILASGTNTVINEFPSPIDSPIIIRANDDCSLIFVVNSNGEAVVLDLKHPKIESKSFKLNFVPIDAKFEENTVILFTESAQYKYDPYISTLDQIVYERQKNLLNIGFEDNKIYLEYYGMREPLPISGIPGTCFAVQSVEEPIAVIGTQDGVIFMYKIKIIEEDNLIPSNTVQSNSE